MPAQPKLIIYLGGKPSMNGIRRRDFLWNKTHNCYVYGGGEIAPDDFNAKYELARKNAGELLKAQMRVRVVYSVPVAVPVVPVVVEPPKKPLPKHLKVMEVA